MQQQQHLASANYTHTHTSKEAMGWCLNILKAFNAHIYALIKHKLDRSMAKSAPYQSSNVCVLCVFNLIECAHTRSRDPTSKQHDTVSFHVMKVFYTLIWCVCIWEMFKCHTHTHIHTNRRIADVHLTCFFFTLTNRIENTLALTPYRWYTQYLCRQQSISVCLFVCVYMCVCHNRYVYSNVTFLVRTFRKCISRRSFVWDKNSVHIFWCLRCVSLPLLTYV